MHELSIYVFELPDITEWIAGDDRALIFEVVDGAGDPVDISNATVEWSMYKSAYHDDPADAVLSGDDEGVELVTDDRVRTEEGEWEVRVDGSATTDHWGTFWHRPKVEQVDETVASWRGRIELTA